MISGWVLIIAFAFVGTASIFSFDEKALLLSVLMIFIGVFLVKDLPKIIELKTGKPWPVNSKVEQIQPNPQEKPSE